MGMKGGTQVPKQRSLLPSKAGEDTGLTYAIAPVQDLPSIGEHFINLSGILFD